MSPHFHYIDPNQPTPTHLNRAALKRLLEWLRPYRRPIAVNLALTVVLTGVALLVPLLLQMAIDGVVGSARSVAEVDELGKAAMRSAAAPTGAGALGSSAGAADAPPDAAGGRSAPAPAAISQAVAAVRALGLSDPAAAKAVIRRDAWHWVLAVVLIFAAIQLAAQGIYYVTVRRTAIVAQQFMCSLRERFFVHLHSLSLRYYDHMKAGQVISRGTADMDALQDTVTWAPSQMLGAVLMILGSSAAMLWKDRVLFLAVVPVLPALYLLSQRFRVRATEAWRLVRAQTGRLTANVAESIAGARVIQAFAREQKNMEQFSQLTGELYDSRVETQRVHSRYMVGIRSVWTYSQVAVILVGAYRIVHGQAGGDGGQASAGEVAAFLAYVAMFFGPMDTLSDIYNQLLHSLTAADRITEVLDAQPEIVDAPGAVSPADFDGEVEFDHVTFAYNPGVTVLRDLSLRARPGEVIALVGPTGAGKTTICRLIARFYEAQEGAVRIDRTDVRKIAQAALHRRMGIVLQENFLFAGTVMDNIRYGRPLASDDEVLQCARRIGSDDAINALPKAFQTEVGERGATLSAGQRQLICFTRAMLADPRILILDEATSSVDTQTELKIQEALRRLTEQRTSFIVAHRLSTVRRADRVFVIEAGRVTEQGTHSGLLAAGGRYAKMYQDFIRSE